MKKINLEKIKYHKPNNSLKLIFIKEKYKLKKILPQSAEIEHVGSTAIPNLGGKNIIDIFIGVPNKLIITSKKSLQENNYTYDSKWGGRMFFIKKYRKDLRLNIHLIPIKNIEFSNAILLRNYLNKNRKAVKDYIKGKKYAIEIETGSAFSKVKNLKEKVKLLNENYDKWFFVVTKRKFIKKFKQFGDSVDKRYVRLRLNKLLKLAEKA